MLLRRVTENVKAQNWFAVVLDFLIVVTGVFIGLQVANWNDARANRTGVVNSLERLRDAVNVNIASIDDRIARIDENAEVRAQGLQALNACDGSTNAVEALRDAVGSYTSDILPSFISNTTKELARQDRYLDLLSEDFRQALNIYDGSLIDESEQLKINFGLMWDDHVIKHPFVTIETGVDIINDSRFMFSAPMDAVCNDPVFRRQIVMTEIWHQSTKLRLERFKTSSETFLAALDNELNVLQ